MSKTEKQCCAEVYDGGRSFFNRYSPCSRAGKYEEDGKFYCKQHLPSEVKRRREAQYAEHKRKQAARTLKRDIEAATAEVANIAVKALHQEATYDDVMEAAAKLDRLREAGE